MIIIVIVMTIVIIVIIVLPVLIGLEDGAVGGPDLVFILAPGGLKLDLIEQNAVIPVPGDLLLDQLGGGDTGVAERGGEGRIPPDITAALTGTIALAAGRSALSGAVLAA